MSTGFRACPECGDVKQLNGRKRSVIRPWVFNPRSVQDRRL